MEITESDKAILKALMKDAAAEVVQPLHEKLDRVEYKVNNHHQTLYGPEGNAGLYGKYDKMDKRIVSLEITKKQVVAWAAGVSAAISTGAMFIKSLIKGE